MENPMSQFVYATPAVIEHSLGGLIQILAQLRHVQLRF